MQILVKDLLNDTLYRSATFEESIDMDTYRHIFEIFGVNPDKSYDGFKDGNSTWTFIGNSGVKHFIKLNKGAKEKFEIKIGFLDNGKLIYDKPNLYFNNDIYKFDEKVLNTYVKILIDDVLPYFFSNMPNEAILFPAIDKARYRLYKMMVERFVDKEKFEIIDDDGSTKFSIKQKS